MGNDNGQKYRIDKEEHCEEELLLIIYVKLLLGVDQSNWMKKCLLLKFMKTIKILEEVFFFCGDDEDNLCKRWISSLNIANNSII